MTHKQLKDLIEDLRLNHEFCPKEVILQAADELEKQRTWVGLTDEEMQSIAFESADALSAVFVAEAKLKEKNT